MEGAPPLAEANDECADEQTTWSRETADGRRAPMSDSSDDLDVGRAAAEAVATAFQAGREQPLAFAAELLLEALSRDSGWEELVAALSAEELTAI